MRETQDLGARRVLAGRARVVKDREVEVEEDGVGEAQLNSSYD